MWGVDFNLRTKYFYAMTYEKRAKNLVERFLKTTQNYDKAVECAKTHLDLIIEEIKSETFVNSLGKLKLHEATKIKQCL